MKRWLTPFPKEKLVYVALIFAIPVLVAAISQLPKGEDWPECFRPATIALIRGKNVYDVKGIFNPPWAFIPLIPFALLPWHIGSAALAVSGLISCGYAVYRLGGKPIDMLLMLISPPVIQQIVDPNLDWLVMLGVLLPARWGLFLVMVKPQVGLAVAVFWLIEAWQRGKTAAVIHDFAPVVAASLISLWLYGLGPLGAKQLVAADHNISLWPYAIPLGLGFLVLAVRRHAVKAALLASPLLTPYIGIYSMHVPMLGLLPHTWWLAIGVCLLWWLRAGGYILSKFMTP
jgi:hypothetical protein